MGFEIKWYKLSDNRKCFDGKMVEILGIHRKDTSKFKVKTKCGQMLIVSPNKLTPLKKVEEEVDGRTIVSYEEDIQLTEFITSHPSRQLLTYP